MSLLKKMKNKKLNAVVYASIMAFGISGNVEAASYPPLFSGPVYNEGFALLSGGDFSGYYDWPSLVEKLGDAETVLSTTGGITEDEIKDLISNVEGDQTVNGSQDITGDQTVEGEQTVKSGA